MNTARLSQPPPAGQLPGMEFLLCSCSRNPADEWWQLMIPVLIMDPPEAAVISQLLLS